MPFCLDPEIVVLSVAVTGTASTAVVVPGILTVSRRGNIPQVELIADGCDVVVAFGGSSVAAVTTVDGTTRQRPAGNFFLKNGAIVLYDLKTSASNVYISAISADGSSTGNLRIKTSQGEK